MPRPGDADEVRELEQGVSVLPGQDLGESVGAGDEEQVDVLAALLAPEFGLEKREMPSFTALLLGPLYRGAEVTA